MLYLFFVFTEVSLPGTWSEKYTLPYSAVPPSLMGASIVNASLMGATRSLLHLVHEGHSANDEVYKDPSFTDALHPGSQSAIRVRGYSGKHELSDLHLRATLSIRGAVVRTSTESLCRLTTQPNLNLPRVCKNGVAGAFEAVTFFNWPAGTPAASGGDPGKAAVKEVIALHGQDIKTLSRWLGKGSAQVGSKQHWFLARAFAKTALELPQPFTIIESGNFCGAVTLLLVRLKQRFCPNCALITIDPTLQAHQARGRRGTGSYADRFGFCSARKTLAHFELTHLAEAREGFGADALLPVPLPIGFAYFDDGKIREAMAPQMALISDHIMEGAYLAYDDYTQTHWTKGPVRKLVADHAELMRELESSGEYETLLRVSNDANFGLQRRLPRSEGSNALWAEIALELVQKRSRVSVARGVIGVASAPDAGLNAPSPAWNVSSAPSRHAKGHPKDALQ